MRSIRTSRRNPPADIGTLWTLRRHDRSARCALIAWPDEWEVRVVLEDAILLAERCERADDAFELAERWKHRMLEQGWRAVIPRPRRVSAEHSKLAP